MSKLKKAGKAIGILSGASATASLLKSTGESVAGSMDHIGSMSATAWKAATKRPERLPDVPADMAAEDQFWTYMQRFGKGPEHLPALRMQTCQAAYMSALGASGFLAMLFVFPLGNGIVVDAARLIVPTALAAVTVKHAFANWLFRNERHGSFREFLKSGDWIPRRW
ncbi:hypothetical protein FJ955_02035 [Mesorhizobium sp. B2-2-2]|uniref:hypothetical protein n=1 Tax=Mesorhizobium sp. B2-2-2 TaxID=2589964 RepID=UPI001127B4FF|nr:hypothetical protein [Mesorhizobium sp. B2-2-2]TPM33551.1 hypothetical protein FJ955_02035 [Mesorhizobium sp. B2-2-2]